MYLYHFPPPFFFFFSFCGKHAFNRHRYSVEFYITIRSIQCRCPMCLSSVSGITSSFSNLHASSPNPTPAPEMLDSRVLRPQAHASHAASVPSIQISKLELCPGVEIVWAPGSIWSTYPYHQHLIYTIGWTPASFNKTENKIYLRSDKCLGELSEFDLSPCVECRIIPYSSCFKDFSQRAKEAMDSEHTPWDYLTSEQLQGLAKRLVCDLKKLRTKVSRLF